MASHPARPSWQNMPSAGSTGGGTSHPARPFGTEGAGVTPATSHPGFSRTGRATPLGTTPTRSPEMTPPPSIDGDGSRE